MAKNRLDYQAQLSRHPHDLEGGYAASLCPGAIVPQYFDILQPGDSVYYRTHMFARLQDLVTAFLGEVDVHLDYFFVPLQMLYTPCGQIFAQTDDFLSSIYSQALAGKDYFPIIKPDLVSIAHTQSTSLVQSQCPQDMFHETIRLFDALDANPLCVFDNDYYGDYNIEQDPQNVDFSICNMPPGSYWPFLAYQAIYQKYYRNDELERLNVAAYNVDHLYNQQHFTFGEEWFRLRYHQRVSDFFTTMRPSPILSSVNSIVYSAGEGRFPNNGGSADSLLYAVNNFLGSGDPYFGPQMQKSGVGLDAANNFDNVSSFGNFTPEDNTASFLNAANIRALFAVDKYTRIYGRADKTYDDQILAHFGIHIPHDVKHDLTHLKHYRAVLQADPIYGTANVANTDDTQFLSTIGQVGGQGQVTLDTQEEKFTAPVHGVFMCVAYVLTKPRYINTFSPLHLIANRLDLPIAEYDKLGAQPMYRYIYNPYYLQDGSQGGNSYMNSFSGWINRYQQYKRKYNRSSLLYAAPINGHVPADSHSNVYAPYVLSRDAFGHNGAEVDNSVSSWMDSRLFFESPNALDSVMVRHYDGNMHAEYWKEPHLALQSDPILTDFICYCKKVSWMSETGEPDL